MTTEQINGHAVETEQRHVQVWFGSHVIASYKAEPADAEHYAAAMDKRYPGLRITNEPDPVPSPPAQPLQPELLWGTVPPH